MRASRALVYATAAARPGLRLRVHAGPVSTRAREIAVVVTAVVYGVEVYASGVRPRWPGAFTGPMLLVVAALPVAVAVSPDRRAAFDVVRNAFLEPAALFGVACSVLTTPREMGRFVRALLLGGGAMALAMLGAFSYAAVTGQPDILGSPPVVWYPRAASVGLLLTPLIALAGAMLLLLPGPLRRAAPGGAAGCPPRALPPPVLTLRPAGWLALGAGGFPLALAVTPGRPPRVGGLGAP